MKKKIKCTPFVALAHSHSRLLSHSPTGLKGLCQKHGFVKGTALTKVRLCQKAEQPVNSFIVPPLTMQSKQLRKKKILTLFLRAEKKAEKFKFFRKSHSCLIGVSGGQDSICLGIFIRSLQRKWKFKFEFVYCHHAWQQENFHTLMQITQYAAYTGVGYFVFLNPRSSSYY